MGLQPTLGAIEDPALDFEEVMTPEAVVARALGVPSSRISIESSNQNLEEWDSLGHITLLLELEAEYGTSFSAEESLELISVEAIHRALEARGITW